MPTRSPARGLEVTEAQASARDKDDATLGREAAEAIVELGLKAPYVARDSTTFARAALAHFGTLFGQKGLSREMVEGAKQGAEALNVEAFHGVLEVVQNAEDQGASEVSIAIANDGPEHVLLLVHNGAPIEFHQLVAMSYAFLSTKRDDAKATGRFGVGLKTLGRIARDLEIHCAPYDVDVRTEGPRAMRSVRDIPDFYSRADRDTLLRLHLTPDFRVDDFIAWFRELGSDVLLFLNHVESLRLIDLRGAKSKAIASYKIRRLKSAPLTLSVGTGVLEAKRLVVKDADGREWIRVTATIPVPREQRRRYKATGPTTDISIAVQPGGARGRLFAGLPLRVDPTLPFAINAQFDPDTARMTLQQREWNSWILKRSADLLEGVARWEAKVSPATCWRWIPLRAEASVPGQPWLTSEIEAMITGLQRTLARRLAFGLDGSGSRLAEISYEDEPLTGLVSSKDLERLRPGRRPLPDAARDEDRWRSVLGEIGGAERVDIGTAIAMFSWPETRDPEWYLGLASTALSAGMSLIGHRSVLLVDGTAMSPPKARSGVLLVLDETASEASVALGLAVAIHPIYSASSPAATQVREWLEKHSSLRGVATGRDALISLAERTELLEVTDEQLLVIRNVLFGELSVEDRRNLGADVGSSILVDGFEFDGTKTKGGKPKRNRVLVIPAEAYMSAGIDGSGRRSWPTAAGELPGIQWIDARYRPLISTSDDQAGARALFSVLGAGVTPRLVPREDGEPRRDRFAYRQLRNAGRLQAEAIDALPRWTSHLLEDHVSPDLDRVVEDLVASPVAARRDRAIALLTTIAEHWRGEYSDLAEIQATYSSNRWVPAGAVPATWLSRLASQPWLSNQRRKPAAPMDLGVASPRTIDVFGADPLFLGFEFGTPQARHVPALEAMGVTVEPTVSDILAALRDLRSQDPVGSRPTILRAAGLYDLLADNCASLTRDEVKSDDPIGDMTVESVRGAFGIGKAKGKGLIVAEGAWWSPQGVFRGRPIFGKRRAFVPERKRADGLWELLNVRRPRVRDCLQVLDEIAQAPLSDVDLGLLIDIYGFLGTEPAQGAEERQALSGLPLWSGAQWIRDRPIFAVDDPQVTLALSEHEPVWQAPVPLETLADLPQRLGVTRLDLSRFVAVGIDASSIAMGARILEQFRGAVAHLEARLARRDRVALDQLRSGWKPLREAVIALTPDLGIEVRIKGREDFTVPVRSHIQQLSGRLVFAVSADDHAGNPDAGGRAIASLFGDVGGFAAVDREKIALTWAAVWNDAGKGIEPERIVFATDESDDALDPLEGLANDIRQAKDWRRSKGGLGKPPKGEPGRSPDATSVDPDADGTGDAQAPLPMRHLKRLDDLAIGDVTVDAGSKPRSRDQAASKKGKGLVDPPPAGDGDGTDGRPGGAILRAYTDTDRQQLAVGVLRRVLETDKRTLRDLTRVANLGADVVDNLDKFFEIKAAAGEMPDVIRLQHSELERSLERSPGHWFLAVIAGLEEGFETRIRFVVDPLKNLTWSNSGAVNFSGVRRAKAIEISLATAPATGDRKT